MLSFKVGFAIWWRIPSSTKGFIDIELQTTLTMSTLCVMGLLKAFMDMQKPNVGTTWKKPRKGKEPMVDEEN